MNIIFVSTKRTWLAIAFIIVLFDQLTKKLVLNSLSEFQVINIFPFFDFIRLHNRGAAFSFLSDASGWQHWFFLSIGTIISVGIIYWIKSLPEKGRNILIVALFLILAGAIGNIIDRLLHGYVIDFLSFHYEGWYFPAFNVADSSISIGASLFLVDSFINNDLEINDSKKKLAKKNKKKLSKKRGKDLVDKKKK